ncbi:hypothetical protein TNCV_2975401 [Trichonephila clavipes]|nr:hypothetical protein TNCV_2975401 [Trichonephila clavipes]
MDERGRASGRDFKAWNRASGFFLENGVQLRECLPIGCCEFHAEIVEVEIGSVAIYRPFGESRRAKSYCYQYDAQGQRQAYF